MQLSYCAGRSEGYTLQYKEMSLTRYNKIIIKRFEVYLLYYIFPVG